MNPVVVDRWTDDDAQRFWARVSLPIEEGCQLWLGSIGGRGYGSFDWDGRQLQASRVALALATGELPAGLQAAHSCRNRHCVAPAHLRWATRSENAADKLTDDTHARGERNAQSRLSSAQVVDIRSRYAAGGCSYQSLAIDFGVSPSGVRNIVLRRSWAWLVAEGAS